MESKRPIKKLSEVCIINPKKAEISGFPDDTAVSFVPMSSVDEFSQSITLQEEKELSEVKKGYTYFRKGDILFAKITPCMENGKVAHAKNLKTEIGFGSTEFHILRAGAEVLPEYIYSLISSSAFRVEAEKKMTGSAGQKRVPKDFVENYELVIPSLEEQRRVVNILETRIDSIKKAIQLRQDAITDTEKILSAKLTELLTEGAEKVWEEKKIAEVAIINPKKSEVASYPDDTEITFVPMAAVSDTQQKIVDREVRQLGGVRKGYTYFKNGDLLFAKITPCMENGKVAIAKIETEIGFGTTEFHVLREKEGVSTVSFLFYLLASKKFREEAEKKMTGSAGQKRVPKDFIEKYKIAVPNLKTQEKIVKELDDLSVHVAELRSFQEAQLSDLKSLERAYLHEAFNGELV